MREIAAREHTDPSGRPVRLTRWTLDVWIRRWHRGGFDALVPSPRQSAPRTPPEVMELAVALKKENLARTAALAGDAWRLGRLRWAAETSMLKTFVNGQVAVALAQFP